MFQFVKDAVIKALAATDPLFELLFSVSSIFIRLPFPGFRRCKKDNNNINKV
jgi:hypothetical protein